MQPEQQKEQSQPSCSWPADGSADCSGRSLTAAGRSIHPACALLLCQISLLSLSGFSFHFSVFLARTHNHFSSAQAGSRQISLGSRAGWGCSWCSKASSPGNCRGNPDLLRAQAEQHLPLGSAEQGSQSTQPSSLLPPHTLQNLPDVLPHDVPRAVCPSPSGSVHRSHQGSSTLPCAIFHTDVTEAGGHQSGSSSGFPQSFHSCAANRLLTVLPWPGWEQCHSSAPAETPPQLPGLCPATPEQAAGLSYVVL